MPKIVIVTDTWRDSVNGIVTSLLQAKKVLELKGFQVKVICPGEFKTVPLPTYSEIKLSLLTRKQMEDILQKEKPNYIHIATEGPLGLAARMVCTKNNWRFTSYYYTQLPEYIQVRLGTFKDLAYKYLRWFHNASQRTFVTTISLEKTLEQNGFKHLVVLPLGVDTNLFKRNLNAVIPAGLKKPIFVFLGRLAPEKNLEVFLRCDLPGSKLIIGDGPNRQSLERNFAGQAKFVGYKTGQELVDILSVCDVFVLPSKTETFCIAMLESLACGLPVAAFDEPGPRDIITQGVDGYIGANLQGNAIKCLELNPENCIKKALKYSSDSWSENLLANLVPI